MSRTRRRRYASAHAENHTHHDGNFSPAMMSEDPFVRNNESLNLNRTNSGAQQSSNEYPPRARSRSRASNPSIGQRVQPMRSSLKRKWQGKTRSSDERPAQRTRQESKEPFVSEEYLRSRIDFPTGESYPNAPKMLFGDQVANAVHNIGGNIMRVQQRFTTHPRGGFRCEVTGDVPGSGPEKAIGDALNKRDAARTAYKHFVAKIHTSGALKEMFPNNTEIDRETMEDEADAMVDVYNYAARFGLVPQISFRRIPSPLRSRKRDLMEVSIKLPEHDIQLVVRSKDMQSAEIAASLKFREEAGKYHGQHGESSIVINDALALNTNNIKNFLAFYKFHNKHAEFQTEFQQVTGLLASGSHPFKAQVKLNGDHVGKPVVVTGKKRAEELAYLTAAVELGKEDPDLLDDFRHTLETSSGSSGILLPIRPLDMIVDPDAALLMRDTLYDVRKEGLPDVKEDVTSVEDEKQSRRHTRRRQPSPAEFKARSNHLIKSLESFNQDPTLQSMREKKESLPMNKYRMKVLDHIEDHSYCIIIGATGCGKTTQVPQILLENAISKGTGAACNVICTQPRRIAATSIARRVSEERNEKLQDTVGYHVRFDSKLPRSVGSITYCTTGILLQQLQHSPDDILDNVSHLVIDEIHERDIIIDFLLTILKKAMTDRRSAGKSTPRVVLMSATIDSELFANYFQENTGDGQISKCPCMSVPGRTFPVAEKYLDTIKQELHSSYNANDLRLLQTELDTRTYLTLEEDFSKTTLPAVEKEEDAEAGATIEWKRAKGVSSEGGVENEKDDALIPINLVALTIAHISKTSDEGAVLVFLPGLDEIRKVDELLRQQRVLGVDFNDESKYKMSMLHSTVSADHQAQVFKPVSAGCRKIILSTNIAETSVTIPDVKYVVDTGKLREKRYDQLRRITKLQCTWISKSNAKQRAGRAGRVRNGNYYALYSEARFNSLRAVGLPEMLRSDLQEICLDIKAQAFQTPIRQFLADAIEPPSPTSVDQSVKNLVSLEALTEEEELTALGRLLASLPVHPSLGKMIVLGVIFRCLDPMVILGSASTERSLFVAPIESRREAQEAHKQFLDDTNSDHLAWINAFQQLRSIRGMSGVQAMHEFAHRNFLHANAFKVLDSTSIAIEEVLVEAGLIPSARPADRFQRGERRIGGESLNRNSHNITLVKALVLAGFHPNLGIGTGPMVFRTPGEKNVLIHPSSLNYSRDKDISFNNTLMSYSTLAKANDGKTVYLRSTTMSTPLMAVLFGGRLKIKTNVIEMDGWLPFYVQNDARTVKIMLEFRKALDRVLTSAFQKLADIRANESSAYLADDRMIDTFASGLVQVLKMDFQRKPDRWRY